MIAPHQAGNEDASTVQVTDANSLLGTQLIEGDWEEALQHLDTPEGAHDVISNNNPLGLFSSSGSKNIPKNKTSALFAALFVRAPYDVISKIYEIAPNHFESDDLAYTLSVIPSEEEDRLISNPRQRIQYRSRAWLIDEYNQILRLLLQHYIDNPVYSSTSPFLTTCPAWVLPFPLTTLAIAAYNPDVSEKTLQLICSLEPKAINIECKLFGVQTLPFIIAAASPVPPKPSISASVSTLSKYDGLKENRWRKVKLLCAGSDSADNPMTREASMDEIRAACEEAMKRNEWELVREFLKRQDETTLPLVEAQFESSGVQASGMDVDIKVSPVAVAEPVSQIQSTSSSSFEQFRVALAEHDKKAAAKRERSRAHDDWAHKNMGLVMYPIDAVVDLATAMIPRSWLKKRHGGDRDGIPAIVSPMS